MSCSTYLKRFFVVQFLTAYYTVVALLMIASSHVRDLFVSSSSKRRLEPPPSLTDPKYGVHKYIKVNNIKLHYVESGNPTKPLMLFIHGFPEFWYSWRHQIVDFQEDYWCIAVDMRGYGDSERPEGIAPYKINEMTEDIRDLIKQLGRERCILVSHDWGGLIACKFRDLHPEMLSACVVLASLSIETWLSAVWNNPAQTRKSWSMLVPGKNTITSEDIECYKYWFGKTGAFTPPVNYYRANFVYCLPEKQLNGNVPMLVAFPSNDPYVALSILDSMKKEYDADTAVIENSGHFLQQEEPEKVNRTIREFLIKHNISN